MTASAANKWTKRKLRANQCPICGLEFNITYAQDSGWILPLLDSQGANTRLGCVEMGPKEIIIFGAHRRGNLWTSSSSYTRVGMMVFLLLSTCWGSGTHQKYPKVLSPSKAADEVKRFDAQFERCFVARMEVRLGLPPVGALAKI